MAAEEDIRTVTQKDNCAKTEREGSHLNAKERDAEDTTPADLDLTEL